MTRSLVTSTLLLALPALLFGDFRYDQTTRITKGMMMKLPFGKKPEPTTSTTYFKGGRLATVSKDSTSIIDFDKQLFTTLVHDKKQYWQMTFAEMQQMMNEMAAEANKNGNKNNVSAEMQFEAKATGTEKDVNGYQAKQVLMTIAFTAKDGKSQQSGSMKMINDSWHSEAVPGYAEYKAQMAKLADKASWLKGNPMAGAMGQPGMAEGIRKMSEEMAKVPGIPVLTISRVGMAGGPNVDMSQMEGQGPSQADIGDAAKRAGGEAAGSTAGRAVGGRLGGMIGGGLGGRLGGFGRKKNEEAEAQARQAEEQARAQAQEKVKAAEEKTADGMMLIMESVTDASNFSSSPIGEEVFAIPAGYTKVDNEWAKRRK